MDKRCISGFLGMMVLLSIFGIINLTGMATALQPIQGTYDPNNPLEFMMACCQWELMKKIEVTLLGTAPEEYYASLTSAQTDLPGGWSNGAGLGQIGAADTKSYDAIPSCCGEYERARAQSEVDLARVSSDYAAWKAAQAAQNTEKGKDDEEKTVNAPQNETPAKSLLSTAELIEKAKETEGNKKVQQTSHMSVMAVNETSTDEVCEACIEAQQFAEWLFSKPKLIENSKKTH
jgi:hypothetical protein